MNDTRLSHPCKRIFHNIIFCLTGLLLFTGCVRYQYISVGSNLYQNNNNEFEGETDTVMLKYSFSGTNFPINIDIFNKLRQPLYVDLKKSVVIMNDIPLEDAFVSDDQLDSIGPQSHATIKSNSLSDKFITLSPGDSIAKAVVLTANGSRNIKQHLFNEATSPVFFKSVLAISTNADLSNPLFYENSFWVSGVYQGCDIPPSNNPSNQFYIQQPTGLATVMGYTLGAILLVGVAAVTPQEQ